MLQHQAVIAALDDAGGFFSKRWGDGPVRTLALGLLAHGREVTGLFCL